MYKNFIPDFHLFDGEAGGTAGATASTQGSEQDVKTIQYGKSKEGEGPAPSQVGSDNGGQDERSARWNALTGKNGEFHDLFGQAVSDAVQKRFKNQADLQGQVDQINESLSPLFMNYGLKTGDIEGLKDAIAHDDTFFKAAAERAGLDVKQYRENLKLQADAERGRRITEAYEAQQRANEVFEKWEAGAEELRQAFPNFDLGLEIENNERFKALLDNGVDVRDAFMSTHLNEILAGADAYHQRAATQDVVSMIQRRASRPSEGVLNTAPAIQRKSDPSSLTNADIDEINERVARGEKISF